MPQHSQLLARSYVRQATKRRLVETLLRRPAKGFIAAYCYVIFPRILVIFSRMMRGKESPKQALSKVFRALFSGLRYDRFPFFIAKLLVSTYGIYEVLGVFGSKLNTSKLGSKSSDGPRFFIAALVAALTVFGKYKHNLEQFSKRYAQTHQLSTSQRNHFENKYQDTFDLTTLAFVRACDILVHASARKAGLSTKRFHTTADVLLFCASSFFIMFNWFYYPQKLSPAYRMWITRAANMDDELVEMLRLVKYKKVIYGVKTPNHTLLNNMCEKYGLDKSMGDTSINRAIPCRLVHQNSVHNCEMHALWRFYRGVLTAMSIYVPLNALLSLSAKSWSKAAHKICISSLRSSVFLALYIMLNWYSVCLVRTRLGPILFPNATPQQLEDTWGPALGSLVCGLSSLAETPRRRGELALFVAPKAMTAILPQRFSFKHPKIETVLFALSFAVLATGAKQTPHNVRGFFRKLLTLVF